MSNAPKFSVISFDGIDDYVALPVANNDYSQGFTVEAWVQYTSFKQSWSRIIDFGNGPGQNSIVLGHVGTSNNLGFHLYYSAGTDILEIPNALEIGKWTHIVVTISKSGEAKLYQNGQLVQSKPFHLPDNVNRKLNYIAKSNWSNDGYFEGKITEVRVWNIARTPEEIKQNMNSRLRGNEPGLVGYYPLNGDAKDKTGNANHGTINGAIWQQEEIPVADLTGGNELKSQGVLKSLGRIVVNADEWTISDAGIKTTPDAATFALNIGKYFVGENKGKFHVLSNNFGLTGASLEQTMTKAGHTWTKGMNIPINLETLQKYDGIFIGGDPVNNQVLIEYVKNGGKVYLCAGTGQGGAQVEANNWNTFLAAFGLKFQGAYNGIGGNIAVNNPNHPLFTGVKTLYQNNGNSITDLQPDSPLNQIILAHSSGQGLIGTAEFIKPPAPPKITTGTKIQLKSWKGDYLHRPDSAQGVTSWNTGIGNEWVIEFIGENKIQLKSWKGDYLHRPDSAQGVTSWNTGIGNEWVVEIISTSEKTIPGVIGIGMNNQLYTRKTLTSNWEHIANSGSVLGITVMPDGTIVGIGMNNQLYTKKTLTSNWEHIANSGSVLGIVCYSGVALAPKSQPEVKPETTPVLKSLGRIVVNADEWTISDAGIKTTPDAATFALNIGKYFVGENKGKFHVLSNNFGLTGASLEQTMTKAGHTWTKGMNIPINLETLQKYDGIFIGGDPINNQVLIEYVKNGGQVYLCAGTGKGGAQVEANNWNTFLAAFGLKFQGIYNGIGGNIAVNNPNHPLFAGVKTLYQNNGNSITDLQPDSPLNQIILAHSSGQGLIGTAEFIKPPAPEPTPEPIAQSTPEVKPEPTPEPIAQSTPEVKPESTPEPIAQSTPEVKPEPTPQAIAQSTPEVKPETTVESTPETPVSDSEEFTITATQGVTISKLSYKGQVKRTQSDEYIEISNFGNIPADISGWKITSAGSPKQVFTFPQGTVLEGSKSFCVYTNEVHPETGGFSFGSRSAIWNDAGDEAKLFDAAGNNVSTLAYGKNTVAGIKQELKVPQLKFVATYNAVNKQMSLGGKVTFTEAVSLAIRSFLEDESDAESPLELILNDPDSFDLPNDVTKAVATEKLRSYLNENGVLTLYPTEKRSTAENGETVDKNWIFELSLDAMSDVIFWAIVPRSGDKKVYNYGFS